MWGCSGCRNSPFFTLKKQAIPLRKSVTMYRNIRKKPANGASKCSFWAFWEFLKIILEKPWKNKKLMFALGIPSSLWDVGMLCFT